jgi:transcription elongation factor Elf1
MSSGEDGARCHRCGHYELSLTRADRDYAHCPSCGSHTRWLRVPNGSVEPRDTIPASDFCDDCAEPRDTIPAPVDFCDCAFCED